MSWTNIQDNFKNKFYDNGGSSSDNMKTSTVPVSNMRMTNLHGNRRLTRLRYKQSQKVENEANCHSSFLNNKFASHCPTDAVIHDIESNNSYDNGLTRTNSYIAATRSDLVFTDLQPLTITSGLSNKHIACYNQSSEIVQQKQNTHKVVNGIDCVNSAEILFKDDCNIIASNSYTILSCDYQETVAREKETKLRCDYCHQNCNDRCSIINNKKQFSQSSIEKNMSKEAPLATSQIYSDYFYNSHRKDSSGSSILTNNYCTQFDFKHVNPQISTNDTQTNHYQNRHSMRNAQLNSYQNQRKQRNSPHGMFSSNSKQIFNLDDELLLQIFVNLSSEELCRCSRVCRRWYHLAWHPFLWTVIVIRDNRLDVTLALKTLTKRLSLQTPGVCAIVETIRLNGCIRLTDQGLYTIAKRCPELRRLEIEACNQITNVALFEVFSSCTNLVYLNVSGIYQINLNFYL